MPDQPHPEKIYIGIASNSRRALIKLPDDTYVDRIAPAYGAGIVTDSTGEYTFDLGSLAVKFTYDAAGNQTTATYGPDKAGRYVRQTSTWENDLLMAESAWELVTP